MTSDSRSRRSPVASHIRALPRSGIRDFFDIVATRDDVISLGIGEPDFTTPWHISERAIYSLEHGATHYTANRGLAELRRAICRYTSRPFGLDYDWKDETLVTVGVSEALDLAIRAIVEPGDEILYHEPCFVAYAPIIRMAHGVPVAVPTRFEDGFRLRREELEARVTPRTRALLINFPNNPTGAILSPADADMIADFVRAHDLLLITDEVYSELTYGDAPRVSVATRPGMRERTRFMNGFSKAWAMTGFRLGYACGPADVIDAMMKIHQYGIMSAPTLSQYAGVEAMERGDDDVARMRAEYRRRRDFLVPALNKMGLATVMPRGAFYIFADIRSSGISSQDFALRLLNEHAVACVPGSAFGACGEGFVRMSYATSLAKIRLAVDRIAAFVRSLE